MNYAATRKNEPMKPTCEIIHHETNDVIELVLTGDEGTERIWLTYEEATELQKTLRVFKPKKDGKKELNESI